MGQRILFILFLCLFGGTTILSAQSRKSKMDSERIISVDYENIKGPLDDFFKQCIGAGRAAEGLRADWQQQLLEAKQECGFERIRFHALFHNDMAPYREDGDGTPHYNWQYIDALYDYLVEIGVKPFVELSFTPEQMKTGDQTLFWWKCNVTPPDNNKWEALVRNFALHLKERYGEEEVATWYFEVWNEPNLNDFFAGTCDQYFKLYEHTARAIKAASPRFRIGGPATAGCAWIPELMEYCKQNSLPLDFVTTHHYSVSGFLDEYGVTQLRMSPDAAEGFPTTISQVVKQANESIYPNIETHFTEWSSSYNPRDPIHDVYQNATIILNAFRRVNPAPASMSYWVFTDIFEEPGPATTPFHGGFGLMTIQGIKKPAYYAYKFLNELGKSELINTDRDSWVCTNGKNDIEALFWNIKILDQKAIPNPVFYRMDLPPTEEKQVVLQIANLPVGKYIREIYRIGYKYNDAFTAYYEMGLPEQLNKEQVNILKKMSDGSPTNRKFIEVTEKGYKESFKVRTNDVFFVKLKKIN